MTTPTAHTRAGAGQDMASATGTGTSIIDERGFRVLVPDPRGHGRSEVPDLGNTPQEMADDLAALIDAADTGPVTAVGHSMSATSADTCCRNGPAGRPTQSTATARATATNGYVLVSRVIR
ncbi:alpha/beta hydrolase [Streptomyces scabiei]|uniref:alpha/beta fold hydrolase n=1 Tax=Streptomyces scabiei TaxID=1930 RepID=UPI00340529FA